MLSFLCGYARGQANGGSGSNSNNSESRKDLEIGNDKGKELEWYFDKNKSDLELHIHSDTQDKTEQRVNVVATSIANYTAKRPDEVPLKQFEKVLLLSQHKSRAIVRKNNGMQGKVPASLLNFA